MDETRSRNVLNLIASPIRTQEYLLGTLFAALVRVAIAIAFSAGTCFALYRFNPLTVGWAMLLIIPAILAIGFMTSILLIALQLRIGDSAENLTWVIAIVPPSVSGAFVPLSALPESVQPLAQLLPATHVFAAARGILRGDAFPAGDLGVAACGIAVTLVVFTAFSVMCVRQFRARGLVTRYS